MPLQMILLHQRGEDRVAAQQVPERHALANTSTCRSPAAGMDRLPRRARPCRRSRRPRSPPRRR
jgi:hypothetical protein